MSYVIYRLSRLVTLNDPWTILFQKHAIIRRRIAQKQYQKQYKIKT